MKRGFKYIGALCCGLLLVLSSSMALAKEIVINIPARELSLEDNGQIVRTYPIAVGKPGSQTPVGKFKVVEKIVNPTWRDPGDLGVVIPSGPNNPLGYRWIGIGGNYGIHGTNNPGSIGNYASHGCIRMHERDVEDLFARINVGTPVTINYNTLILKEAGNGTIGFIAYNDVYNRKPVKAANLMKELTARYPSVKDFVTLNQLQQLIQQAGYNHYREIIRPLQVRDVKDKYHFYGYMYNEVLYLPLAEVAQVAKTYYDVKDNILSTKAGSAEVAVFNKRYYIPLTSIPKVFPLFYGFEDGGQKIVLEKRSKNTEQNDLKFSEILKPQGDAKEDEITQKPVIAFIRVNPETNEEEIIYETADLPMETDVKKLKQNVEE